MGEVRELHPILFKNGLFTVKSSSSRLCHICFYFFAMIKDCSKRVITALIVRLLACPRSVSCITTCNLCLGNTSPEHRRCQTLCTLQSVCQCGQDWRSNNVHKTVWNCGKALGTVQDAMWDEMLTETVASVWVSRFKNYCTFKTSVQLLLRVFLPSCL